MVFVPPGRRGAFKPPGKATPATARKPLSASASNAASALKASASTSASSGSSSAPSPASAVVWTCRYCKKGPKKRKAWQDGALVVGEKMRGKAVLMSAPNTNVASTQLKAAEVEAMCADYELDAGNFHVELAEQATWAAYQAGNVFEGDAVAAPAAAAAAAPRAFVPAKRKFAPPSQRPQAKFAPPAQTKFVPPRKPAAASASAAAAAVPSPPSPGAPAAATGWAAVTGGGRPKTVGSGLGATAASTADSAQRRRARAQSGDPFDNVDLTYTSRLRTKLRPHQLSGVRTLWRMLHAAEGGTGCILADEMGLGKTLSALTVAQALLDHKLAKRCCIVAPASLLANWGKEFNKWLPETGPNGYVVVASADKANIRGKENPVSKYATSNPKVAPILVISYDGYRKHAATLNTLNPPLGLLICDEGHRLKNGAKDNKTYRALSACPATRRLLLTGTPVQNELSELHAMVDFVRPGEWGTPSAFGKEYANPIRDGLLRTASKNSRSLGEAQGQALAGKLARFQLRRTSAVLEGLLPPRHDYTLYCRLTREQEAAYRAVLDGPSVKEILGGGAAAAAPAAGKAPGRDSLPMISSLRKICNHPSLNVDAAAGAGAAAAAASGAVVGDAAFVGASGKMAAVVALLNRVRAAGDERVVLISCFTSVLDAFAAVSAEQGWPSPLRLDGATKAGDRQSLVDRFNRRTRGGGAEVFLFLLSTRAGGVGLNLTGGSRLVLYDSDWNPAIDLQAMARVHRSGQQRTTFVYRCVSAGTIEEKIVLRQIAKGELATEMEGGGATKKAGAEAAVTARHFGTGDLKELFEYDGATACEAYDRLKGVVASWTPFGGAADAHLDHDPALRGAVEEGKLSFVHYGRLGGAEGDGGVEDSDDDDGGGDGSEAEDEEADARPRKLRKVWSGDEDESSDDGESESDADDAAAGAGPMAWGSSDSDSECEFDG